MRCMQASIESGSDPSSALARPRVMPLDSGASTAARTTVGAESTSPQPVMPASVSDADQARVLRAVGGGGDVGQSENDGPGRR